MSANFLLASNAWFYDFILQMYDLLICDINPHRNKKTKSVINYEKNQVPWSFVRSEGAGFSQSHPCTAACLSGATEDSKLSVEQTVPSLPVIVLTGYQPSCCGGRVCSDRFCEGASKAIVAGFYVESQDSREMRSWVLSQFNFRLPREFRGRKAGWLHSTWQWRSPCQWKLFTLFFVVA